jgi:hypothetical protein
MPSRRTPLFGANVVGLVPVGDAGGEDLVDRRGVRAGRRVGERGAEVFIGPASVSCRRTSMEAICARVTVLCG